MSQHRGRGQDGATYPANSDVAPPWTDRADGAAAATRRRENGHPVLPLPPGLLAAILSAAAHFQADIAVENVLAEIDGRAREARYEGRVQCCCETGKNQALKIEMTYATPPERPRTSYLAHHQKAILNRLYFSIIPPGWL